MNGKREISLLNSDLNPTVYSEKIFYYPGIVSNSLELLDLIESTDKDLVETDCISKWSVWKASKEKESDEDYVFGYQKQTDASKLESSSQSVQTIYNSLFDTLLLAGEHYSTSLGVELVPPSPLSISKYVEGSSMGPHVDYHGEPDIMPLMSGVIYLNDTAVGGELHFKDQDVTIKPVAGSIIIFPSVEPYYHESLPVQSGTKYMSPVFWVKRFN